MRYKKNYYNNDIVFELKKNYVIVPSLVVNVLGSLPNVMVDLQSQNL